MNELELFESYMKKEHPFVDTVSGAYEAMWNLWKNRVPEGYVVVPKEPSAKMIEIGSNALGNGKMGFATYMDVNNSYKAMIEAVEK